MADRPLIPRHTTPIVSELLREFRAVALVGPRQSGKSTLARHLLAADWPARYITMDHDASRSAAIDDSATFMAGIRGPTIIDEIQRAPDLMLAIKIRLDNDNTHGQLLLTGSANLTQIRTVKDALPGRVIYQEIWPLTQAEIEGKTSSMLGDLTRGVIPDVRGAPIGPTSYVDRFVRGGFPGPLGSSFRTRSTFFEGYIDAMVERDIPALAGVRTLDGPARVLRLLSARSGMLLNVASLARDLHMDNKTTDHYLQVLRDLMLIHVHQPWFANLGSRQVKSPKVYVADPGLMASLTGADARGIARNPTLMGSFLETSVCTEIVRLLATSEDHTSIYHYRDNKQREVDIVLERPDGTVVGIEVKAGATPTSADFRSLRYLRDGLGARFAAGVVLHSGEQTLPFGERLAAVPIAALWA